MMGSSKRCYASWLLLLCMVVGAQGFWSRRRCKQDSQSCFVTSECCDGMVCADPALRKEVIGDLGVCMMHAASAERVHADDDDSLSFLSNPKLNKLLQQQGYMAPSENEGRYFHVNRRTGIRCDEHTDCPAHSCCIRQFQFRRKPIKTCRDFKGKCPLGDNWNHPLMEKTENDVYRK